MSAVPSIIDFGNITTPGRLILQADAGGGRADYKAVAAGDTVSHSDATGHFSDSQPDRLPSNHQRNGTCADCSQTRSKNPTAGCGDDLARFDGDQPELAFAQFNVSWPLGNEADGERNSFSSKIVIGASEGYGITN